MFDDGSRVEHRSLGVELNVDDGTCTWTNTETGRIRITPPPPPPDPAPFRLLRE